MTVTVNDGGNTGADPGSTADGSSEEDSASQTITVTSLNDDPTNAGSLPSDVGVTEDVLSNIDLSLIDFSDVDAGGSSLTATLSTATGGELTVAAGTGITLGGTATARTFTGTLTNLNNYFNTASNVQYLHATPHTNGDNADSITVLINDNGNTGQGGGTNQNLGAVNVDISAVNDTPVVSGPGSAYLVNEQTGLSIEGTGFTLVDVDAGSGTMTGTFSVGEGGITVSVGDSGVAIGSGNGTGTVVVTGTASQINNLLTGAGTGSITYLNGSDTPSSSTSLTVTVNDGGNTGADPGSTADGSSEEDSASQTITVTSLNDDPTNAGSLPSDVGVTEDVLSNIDLSLIDFSDVDAGGSSLTVTLSTATGGELTVAAGTGITLGGSATARTFTGTLTNLNNYFNTASNVQYLHATPHTNGDNADSITVLVNDNGNTGQGGGANQNLGAVNVDISAVNDTPVVSGPGSAYLVNEQAGLSIEGTGFTLVDVDAGSGTMTGTFSVGEGGITVSVGDSGVAIGSGNGTGTVVVTGTASQINNLLTGAGTGSITYLNGSDTPSSSTSLTVTVNDGGNTGADPGSTADGSSEEDSASQTITVTSLNDDPTNAGSLPSDVSVTEDVLSNIDLSLIDFSDVDAGGSSLTATLSTATGGELTVAAGTGITLGGTATARTFTGTLTDLNNYFNTASNVQYLHATPHTNGDNADSITVLVNDNGNTGQGGGTNQNLGAVNVDISAVNDTPVVTAPASFAATEQTTLILSDGSLTVGDVDSTSSTVSATLTVAEGIVSAVQGDSAVTVVNSGTGTMTLTGSITQINNLLAGSTTGNVTYFNGLNDPSSSVLLTLTVNDGGNTGSDPGLSGDGSSEEGIGTSNILINAVNDAPSTGTSNALSAEDATSVLLSLGGFDSDGTIEHFMLSSLPANGTLYTDAGLTVAASTGVDIAATGGVLQLYFVPDANWNGSTNFQYAAKDDGGLIDLTPATATITISAVNDEQVLATNLGNSVDEGSTGNTITTAMLSTTDVDNTDVQLVYTLDSVPSNGTLRNNGSALALGATFTQADLVGGLVTYDHNGGETTVDSFDFSVDDGTGTASLGTFNWTINPVNDLPVITSGPGGGTYNENAPGTFFNNSLTIADSDNLDFDGGVLTVSVTASGESSDRLTVLDGANVTLVGNSVRYDFGGGAIEVGLLSGGVGDSDSLLITFNTSADATAVEAVAQRVVFNSVSDDPSTAQRTLTMSVTDGDGGPSNVVTRVMNVIAYNDNPFNSGGTFAGSTSTVFEDVQTDLDLSFLNVVDWDDRGLGMTLTLSTSGVGNLYATSGASVTVSGSGTDTLVLTGSTADIDAFLNVTTNIEYLHGTANANGVAADTLTAVLNDGGNFGIGGGGDVSLGTANIDIVAINDSPTLDLDVDDNSGGAGPNYITSFTEGLGPVLIADSDASLGDIDSANLVLMTVTLQNQLDGAAEILSADTTGTNISATYDSGTGVLTLIGSDTRDNYEQVLKTITYNNLSENPDTTIRTIRTVANDGGANSNPAISLFLINAVNDEEVLGANTGDTVAEGSIANTVTTAMLETTDVDNANANLIYTVDSTPNYGTLFRNGSPLSIASTFSQADIDTGLITYSHDGSQTSNDSIGFTVDDGSGTTTASVFNWVITNVNDEQSLDINTGLTLNEGATSAITSSQLLTSDVDNTTGQLVYTVDSVTVNGTIYRGASVLGLNDTFTQADVDGGLVTYSHDAGETASDSFDFTVDDGAGTTTSDTFALTILPVNDAPNTNDVVVGGFEDASSIAINLSGGDVDGTIQSFSLDGLPANGVLYLDAGLSIPVVSGSDLAATANSLTLYFVPSVDWNGSTNFQYAAKDDLGLIDSTSANATINVTAVNDAPVESLIEGGNILYTENVGPVLITNTLALSDVDDTDLESAMVQISGNYFNGQDVLDFANTATITGVWNATTGTLSLTGSDTLANYEAALRSVTYENTSDDPSGSLRTILITVNDGVVDSNVLTRDVDVVPVNDAPVAGADSYTLNEGESIAPALGLLFNDTDVDSSLLTASVLSGPLHGSISLNSDGNFVYVHDGSETVFDSFTYQVADGSGGLSSAQVNLTINPVNDVPVAIDDAYVVNEGQSLVTNVATGILANDLDGDGDVLSASLLSGPTSGFVTLNPNGSFTYANDGSETLNDQFVYQVDDGNGGVQTAVVMLTIQPVNDVPVANPDSYLMDEDTVLVGDVSLNDSDSDGDILSYLIVSGPQNASSFSLNPNGTFSYEPESDYFGNDSFVYQVSDGNGGLDTVNVNISISNVNDAPTSLVDNYAVLNGGVLEAVVGVLDNDFDVDNDVLAATLVVAPVNGTITFGTDGTFQYVPDQLFIGTDRFIYFADDGTTSGIAVEVQILVETGLLDTGGDGDGDGDIIMEDTNENNDSLVIIDLAQNDENQDDDSSKSSSLTVQGNVNTEFVANEVARFQIVELEEISEVNASSRTSLQLVGYSSNPRTLEYQVEMSEYSYDGFTIGYDALLLWEQMDEVTEDVYKTNSPFDFDFTMSSIAGMATLGGVLWILRGGVLMATTLSQLPAWRMIDPLTVLESFTSKPQIGEDELGNFFKK